MSPAPPLLSHWTWSNLVLSLGRNLQNQKRGETFRQISEEHDEDCDCVCGCDMIFAVAAAARGDNGLLDPGPAHINHTTRDIARRHRSYTDPANPGTSQQ